MFCQHCGNKITDDARFCPQCGKAVESAADSGGSTTRDATERTNPPRPAGTAGTLTLSGNYKAPGFLLADRIPGDLTLDDDTLSFKQWGIRMLHTVMTFGLMSYSKGEGLGCPLSEIQSATLDKGLLNATLTVRGKNGKETRFEFRKSGKLDVFYETLLARIDLARKG